VIRIHSYDVFDTALIRRVPVPSDVFRIVGERIAKETWGRSDRHFIEEFAAARIEAERIAAAASANEEVTLTQIWAALVLLLPNLPSHVGPDFETTAEEAAILANPPVAASIAESRRMGKRIIFVSDTYLPADFVRTQLLRHGVAEPQDRCYVSSEYGVTKRSGKLFKLLMEREAAASCEIRHFGDNSEADVVIPLRLGIAASQIRSEGLNTIEQNLLRGCFSSPVTTLRLAGSMRVARLSQNQGERSLADLTGSFLGPIAAVWACWVLASAERDGIQRLYFVSRDAYLVWRAALVLASEFGKIDCRYLQISRQAIMLPAVTEISESELSWLHHPWEVPRLDLILAKLDLSWVDVATHFDDFCGSQGAKKLLQQPSDWVRFWQVLKIPAVSGLIKQRIVAHRAKATAYLKQMGLCESIPSALVDIGWHATVQSRVNRLIGKAGKVSGYYLAGAATRKLATQAGPVRALFYQECSDRQRAARGIEIYGRATVLEHVLGLAPHGTVRQYVATPEGMMPVCPAVTPAHGQLVAQLAARVEHFCIGQKADFRQYADDLVAMEILSTLIESWMCFPSELSLEVLKLIHASEDPNNADERPIAEPWPLSAAALALVPLRFRAMSRSKPIEPRWPEASLLRASLLSKLLVQVKQTIKRIVR
jgi:FMN phosphatase YigB (HAD superfamily)